MQIADDFEVGPCADPHCPALHFRSLDANGEIICLTAIGPESLRELITIFQDHLYAFAAQEDKQ